MIVSSKYIKDGMNKVYNNDTRGGYINLQLLINKKKLTEIYQVEDLLHELIMESLKDE
jgi:hypothetical protein